MECGYKSNSICENCFVIINTNIIDVELGKVDSGMSLIIKNNLIIELGKAKAIQTPKNATIIDGKDKFIIPGLWDMHAHTSSDSITRQVAYPLFIANGITGIRDMIADCYNEEYPCEKYNSPTIFISRNWKEDVANGNLLGPRSVLGSQRVNGLRGDSSTILSPGTPEHGREHVIFLKQRGVDFIKIYEECPRDVFFSVAKEAKNQNLPFVGHVPFEVKISEAAKVGIGSIEHCCDENYMLECSEIEDVLRQKWLNAIRTKTFNIGDIILEMARTYDATKCDEVFNIIKENHAWVVPTLIVSESHYPYLFNWTIDERLKYLPKSERLLWEEWQNDYYHVYGDWDYDKQMEMRKRRFEIIAMMFKKGIPIMAGTDCASIGVFWGSSIHEELELLVQVGLSEIDALRAATLNPALFFKATDSLGSIAKGKIADMVILNKNPLEDIRHTKNINGVFSNGNYFNKSSIDSLLMNVETVVNNRFN